LRASQAWVTRDASRARSTTADAAGDGLAVVISAHQRKSYGEYGEAVRGSNALTGAVDVIVEIERAKLAGGGTARVLRTVSRFDQAPQTSSSSSWTNRATKPAGTWPTCAATRTQRRAPRSSRRG
jgi:hypothetical protein